MIDFRYHVVSLMAVFIALTVGIVLGAGPLQGTLSESLHTQVTYLSKQQTQLNKENEIIKSELNARNHYINDIADSALPGSLEGMKVSVVRAYDAHNSDVKDIEEYLNKAHAKIVSDITLNQTWFSKNASDIRKKLSERMRAQLNAEPDSSASVASILEQSLHDLLVTKPSHAEQLTESLTQKTDPLITMTTQPVDVADAIVFIFSRHHTIDDNKEKKADNALPATPLISLVKNVSTWKIPVVCVGEAINSTDEIAVIRHAELNVSTVDRIGRVMALVSTPLTLAAEKEGKHVNIGFDQGATRRFPRVNGLLHLPSPSPSSSSSS